MKKFLIFSLMMGITAIAVPAAEAKTSVNTAAEAPQIRVQIGPNRRYNRRVRTVVRTTRVGRYMFRETVRVTYLPNGRTREQVISRVRIGGGNYRRG